LVEIPRFRRRFRYGFRQPPDVGRTFTQGYAFPAGIEVLEDTILEVVGIVERACQSLEHCQCLGNGIEPIVKVQCHSLPPPPRVHRGFVRQAEKPGSFPLRPGRGRKLLDSLRKLTRRFRFRPLV
jgi:hypothetical protein